MSEPLSAERLAEIRARCQKAMDGPWTLSDDIEFTVTAMRDIPDLLAEVYRLRAWQALSRLQALAAESGPSRWFSATRDDRHGTDPAWDGTGE